jgi:hypothetical protein
VTVPPRKSFRRISVRTSPSRRCLLADERTLSDLRDLAHRLGIEPPRVIWTAEAREAIKRLQENLRHRQQPTLGGM